MPKEDKYTISMQESYFMDSIRILAATWVMVMHAYAMWFPNNTQKAFHLGHAAVIIFFVLSGFVIAYTTECRNRGPIQYGAARLSRLCSILLPALIITILIEIIVKFRNPEIYQSIQRGNSLPRYISSALFINEIWFFSSAPPINAPLWSLSFEFWYYVIFGIFFYNKKFKNFIWISIIVLLFVGPKILLMMPIWLVGVFAFRLPKPRFSSLVHLLLITIALFSVILIITYLPSYPKRLGTPPLFFAAGFLTDLLIGIFFGIILWLLPTNKLKNKKPNSLFYNYFRKMADLTFPVYVLHHPLLVLFKALFIFQPNSVSQLVLSIIFAFVLSIVLGNYFEKSRLWWNDIFKQILNKIKSIIIIKKYSTASKPII